MLRQICTISILAIFFNILDFQTRDIKDCDCVVRRLRAFEQANCPAKDMRTYFNGLTNLRCEEKDRTRRNSASDDYEYGFYNMKFYPIHVAAGMCIINKLFLYHYFP